ncbi:MAG: nucleoside hydrolase [Promethearchaeota archaeon]
MSRKNVILDTDIGTDIDDAFALAFLLKSPDVKLQGISTVSGNTFIRSKIVKKMLDASGLSDIPVFSGYESRCHITCEKWVKNYQVEAVEASRTSIESLIDFYWRKIESTTSEKLNVLCIGPLTNISAVRELDPKKFDDRVKIFLMGGAIHRGYVKKLNIFPEYNIYMDKDAARDIINSDVELSIVPLDVTADLKLKREDLEKIKMQENKDPLIKALMENVTMFNKHLIGKRPIILFDPATAAIYLDETMASFKKMQLRVTKLGFMKEKRSNNENQGGRQHDIKVCLGLDKKKFYELFINTLVG